MKYFLVSLLILVAACNTGSNGKPIEGVYVGHFEHEYGINDDTLIVKKANDGYMYALIRKTGTVRKLGNKFFPKEWHTENWNLEYYSEKQTFFELKHGKTLIWNKSASTLQLGNIRYKLVSGL